MTYRRLKTSEISLVKKALYDRQGGVCELCRARIPALVNACLDHDHDTGLVRGVLCRNCNGIEGKIKNLARRAARGMPVQNFLGHVILYWNKHSVNKTGLLHPTHKTDTEKRDLRNKKARARRKKAKAVK